MKNKYHVIIEDNGKFRHYDILRYLSEVWSELKPKAKREAAGDLRAWVDRELHYQFWGRCEYEVILSSWPPTKDGRESKKVDIYWQASEDIELITKLFAENERITI